MLTDYELTFPNGSLITGQLLQKMYEYPKNLINYIFADYSEGVISGLNVSYIDQELILSTGIYKHNSSLYILEKDEILCENICFEGKRWYVVLKDSNSNKDNSNKDCDSKKDCKWKQDNIVVRKLVIEVMEEKKFAELPKDNFLLFSFKNEPKFPRSGDDIKKDAYILDYKHACWGTEPTFMPQLFHLVYRKLLSKEARHPFDYIIMGEICTKGIIPCELMRAYISCLPNHISTSELRGKALMDQFWDALSVLKDNNLNSVPTKDISFTGKEESWLL